jgi:hypothetical protein
MDPTTPTLESSPPVDNPTVEVPAPSRRIGGRAHRIGARWESWQAQKAQKAQHLPKPKKPKRPVGRPRKPHLEHAFEPTKEHRELVKLLAGYGIPDARIVKVIRNPHPRRPICIETLHKHFADELESGAMEMDAIACTMLSMQIRKGNLTAIIWYQKNRMGWRDVYEQRSLGELDMTIRIDPSKLAEKLEERGLPASVFGIDKPLDIGPQQRIENGSPWPPEH